MSRQLLTCLLLLMLSWALQAQEPPLEIKSIGLPLIENFGTSDYDAAVNNYDVIIGDDQRIYFGNEEGVLIYDGQEWTKVPLPNQGAVYFFTKSDDGTIYVGGVTESGYLQPNENGVITYHSLNETIHGDSIPGSVRVVTRVEDQIVSLSSTDIAYINPETKEVVNFTKQRWVNDNCYSLFSEGYYSVCGDEIYVLNKDGWKFLRKGTIAQFYEKSLVGPVTVNGRKLMVTKNGFYDFDTDEQLPINSQVKDFLKNNFVYRINLLSNNYLAICSWSGLLITDLSGEPIQFINKAMGLTDDYVFGVAMDNSGVLWVATYNGISKITLNSRFSYLDNASGGHDGIVHDMTLFSGQLYFSTIQGTFRGSWNELGDPFLDQKFTQIDENIGHYFFQSDETLFMTSELDGSLVMNKYGKFETIEDLPKRVYWTGFKFEASDDVLLGGFEGFMVHVKNMNGHWKATEEFDPIFNSVEFIIQGEGQDIWASGKADGLYRLVYDVENQVILDEKKYGIVDGLPSNQNNYVFRIDGQPYFGTEKGIYRYDKISDRIVPDPALIELTGEEPIRIIRKEGEDIFYFSDQLYLLQNSQGAYIKKAFPGLDYKKYSPMSIRVIDNENVLVGSANGMAHLNPKLKPVSNAFHSQITSFRHLDVDTVLFGGFGQKPQLIFAPNQNSFRFKFTTDFHQGTSLFKWKLQGLDGAWSNWSEETSKDYTNLPHGQYTFQVLSRNTYGQESIPATIEFSILPPWYLTLWAYFLYVIIGCGTIYGIIALYATRLKSENRKLEEKVALRTQQLRKQTKELQNQNDLKKRFFVNISHELKTPLTLTLGTLTRALNHSYGHLSTNLEKNLKVSFNNAERLLKMVNSILDISRLESGNMQLKASLVRPAAIIEKVLAFFDSKFLNKSIQLEKELLQDEEIYLDSDKFETMLINLIANAFKFTPENGVIRVQMSTTAEHVNITVKDSGQGIPEQDLPFVFDRFYQSPSVKSGEGLGVGLALTKELMDLHHGEVVVTNEYGAKFVLSFMKGNTHLNENEIALENEVMTSELASKYHLNESSVPAPEIGNKEEDRPHILIVEDNPEMQAFISELLASQFNVSSAANGKQGLEILKEVTPDLIISDYMMPEMDGLQFATLVKQSGKFAFVPFIFLTARTDEEDKLEILNLGVDDYLFKPFNPQELLVRVTNLLYARRARQEYIDEEGVEADEIEWKDFQSDLRTHLDQYIDEHLDAEITTEQLINATKLSERSLYRKVKSNTGLSLLGYVKEYRLRKARIMLEEQKFMTVSEVSYAVGYKYLSHFTKNFKDRFGKQPSEYFQEGKFI
ncbi:MAG: response regulator [Cytophagales bacterium]|nr:response regulator [Cytophagales bacterium]